jgi:GNAT superfamily N-acetyltransferase
MPGEELQVVPADEASLEEFARVMVDAFTTEGINAYAFDFRRPGSLAARRRAARAELRSFFDAGDTLLLARIGAEVVGGAIVSRNARLSWRLRLRLAGRWLFVSLPLWPSVRWRRLSAVRRATRLSRPIEGAYYTLAALAVRPDRQGRGIGRQLLQGVDALSERDFKALGVYLYTGDCRNQRMYERDGYETIETRRAGDLTVYHMFRVNGARLVAPDVNE